MKEQLKKFLSAIGKIITFDEVNDHYWYGGNRAKAAKSPSEQETLQTCNLCGMTDSQNHILNHGSHPAMLALRENAHYQIISHLQTGAKDTSIEGSDKIYHTLHMLWTASTPTPDLWIRRWDRILTDSFTNQLVKFQYEERRRQYSNNPKRITSDN